MKAESFDKKLLLFIFALIPLLSVAPGVEAAPKKQYSTTKLSSPAGTEYWLYFKPDNSSTPHHFLSVIASDGSISIRPHPGDDPNGWGTSWYPQPFFPGAVLRSAKVSNPVVNQKGITLKVSGTVSNGDNKGVGKFSLDIIFAYDNNKKITSGTGNYSIKLPKSLVDLGAGDLNISKIASNFLHNVPLLSGDMGNTGDMSNVFSFTSDAIHSWDPIVNPSYFPQGESYFLFVDVQGQYNNVDTAVQGYEPIAAAYKPGVKLTYVSKNLDSRIAFGAIYDTTKSGEFWQDNVGITPLILQNSPARKFDFSIVFESADSQRQ